ERVGGRGAWNAGQASIGQGDRQRTQSKEAGKTAAKNPVHTRSETDNVRAEHLAAVIFELCVALKGLLMSKQVRSPQNFAGVAKVNFSSRIRIDVGTRRADQVVELEVAE